MEPYINENEPSVINHEFDYSNIIPTVEWISYLVEYCYEIYKQFIHLIEEDQKKNEPLKMEFRKYEYKKSYSDSFEVYIREKTYNNITCKDISSFKSAVEKGNLKEVTGLDIKLNLDYKRGREENLSSHENAFTILFHPYDIKFARKSNYNEVYMMQVEQSINDILKKFPKVNSIFCTKETVE